MSENKLKIIGWIGTALSVTMYVSYIPQIMNNLSGDKLHDMGFIRITER